MSRLPIPFALSCLLALSLFASPEARAYSCEDNLAQLDGVIREAGGNSCRTAFRENIEAKCSELKLNGCTTGTKCELRCDRCIEHSPANCPQCRRASGATEVLICPSCKGNSVKLTSECVIAQDGTCDVDTTEQPCDSTELCIADSEKGPRCAKKFECRREGNWVNRYERLPDGTERKQPNPKPGSQCVSEAVLRDWTCQDDGRYQSADRNCGNEICVSGKEGEAVCSPKFRCEVSQGRVRQYEKRTDGRLRDG